MTGKIERHCIVCGEIFYIKLSKSRRTGGNYRNRRSKTCSPKCSKKYIRQQIAIWNKEHGKKNRDQ